MTINSTLTNRWHTRNTAHIFWGSEVADVISDSGPSPTNPDLIAAMARMNLQPLWDLYKGLNTREPRFLEPLHWPWAEIEPMIDRAAAEVDMAHAERRALMLSHPALSGTTFTTPTLSAALQILEPGEVAHSHRHTLAALRLVVTGDGAITSTDGKECLMLPGDLVLTPSWTWHKHYHPGKQRAVWLDGLDAPLCAAIGTVFFEHGPGPDDNQLARREADRALFGGGVLPESQVISHDNAYSPLFRYPWSAVNEALDAMAPAPDGSRRIRYVNPTNGGPVMPTIDCFAERLAVGRSTRASRSTSTAIAIVLEGEGSSQIGEKYFAWKKNDIFTLPRWQWVQHSATIGPASIFMMTDRSFISNIAQLREENRD
jgi:gentisate 1,2-dioxygenase